MNPGGGPITFNNKNPHILCIYAAGVTCVGFINTTIHDLNHSTETQLHKQQIIFIFFLFFLLLFFKLSTICF